MISNKMMSCFWQALGIFFVTAMSFKLQAAPQNVPAGFVRAEGTQFVLDGKAFYFQGTNASRFGTTENEGEAQIYWAMQQYASKGLRVVRFWGFSCKGMMGQGVPIIEWANSGSIGYNESAWQRLDATIDAARAAGLKVILPLVNFEPSYCGMDWWTQQVIGSRNKHLFYSDYRVKSAFRNHIANLLNRINSRYLTTLGRSIRYKDDPTIMAIEIANEPHTEDNYELNRGLPPGELVYNFLYETADYIRSLDPYHLISTGEEGYKTNLDYFRDTNTHIWINNGMKGVNFEKNVTIPNIDFATVHIYPDNWNIPAYQWSWVEPHLIQSRASFAHGAGKPIVMEESGFNNDGRWLNAHLGYGTDPAWYLSQIYEFANRANYAGTMLWQLMPNGFETGGYDYDFNSQVAAVVFRQAAYMNSRSGEQSQPTIPKCINGQLSDPDGDGWGWENGRSCQVINGS